MVLKFCFKYGLPLSFVYCTVYQQDIWREGDEKLSIEQQKAWRDFFSMMNDGYTQMRSVLNLTTDTDLDPKSRFLAKYDSLDLKTCYNSKVVATFAMVDNLVSNPQGVACRLYRKIQPYVSSKSSVDEKKTQA